MTTSDLSLEKKVNDVKEIIIKKLISLRFATHGTYESNSIYLNLIENNESKNTLNKTLVGGYNLRLISKYHGLAEITGDYLSENKIYRINWTVIAENTLKENEIISEVLNEFNRFLQGYQEIQEKLKKEKGKSKKSNRKYWR
ncbi:MAG: hypothetical protein WC867_07845 [Candidatus Pacearchaeota archaeon]|jgi:hypothetical protein